jgi:hypothetical protein
VVGWLIGGAALMGLSLFERRLADQADEPIKLSSQSS